MVSLIELIEGVFPTVFLTGFVTGFIIAAFVYAIVAVTKLFAKIIKS